MTDMTVRQDSRTGQPNTRMTEKSVRLQTGWKAATELQTTAIQKKTTHRQPTDRFEQQPSGPNDRYRRLAQNTLLRVRALRQFNNTNQLSACERVSRSTQNSPHQHESRMRGSRSAPPVRCSVCLGTPVPTWWSKQTNMVNKQAHEQTNKQTWFTNKHTRSAGVCEDWE